MARNPQCISGNTLLLNVSQDKKYLSRKNQQWPWKKSRPKKKSGKCYFMLSLSVICLFNFLIYWFKHLLYVEQTGLQNMPCEIFLSTLLLSTTGHTVFPQLSDAVIMMKGDEATLCTFSKNRNTIGPMCLWNVIASANRNSDMKSPSSKHRHGFELTSKNWRGLSEVHWNADILWCSSDWLLDIHILLTIS